MAKNIFYEWDIEYTDEYGDVVDHNFCGETFPGIPADPNASLVLVRSQYKPHSADMIDRGWAYVKDGQLPDYFDSGHDVPLRFQKPFIDAAKLKALRDAGYQPIVVNLND